MEHNLSAFYNFAACERIRERSAHITEPENMGQTTGAFTFRQHVRGILAVHKKRGKRECSRCCSRQLFSSFHSRRRLLWYFQPRITSHWENVHASVTTRSAPPWLLPVARVARKTLHINYWGWCCWRYWARVAELAALRALLSVSVEA